MKLAAQPPNVDYAYYLKGLVYSNEDLGLLGRISRQDRTERDPGARESFDASRAGASATRKASNTPDALARMKYLSTRSPLTRFTPVARYYMKRGVTVAASNRAEYALKTTLRRRPRKTRSSS